MIFTPRVTDYIPKFCEAEAYDQLKVKMESWFFHAKAIRHWEALLVAPTAFLKLASAALHHASETIPAMRNYCTGKPINGRPLDCKLREAFRGKLPKSGGIFFTSQQRHILESFVITGEILEQVYKKSSKRRAEPDFMEDD